MQKKNSTFFQTNIRLLVRIPDNADRSKAINYLEGNKSITKPINVEDEKGASAIEEAAFRAGVVGVFIGSIPPKVAFENETTYRSENDQLAYGWAKFLKVEPVVENTVLAVMTKAAIKCMDAVQSSFENSNYTNTLYKCKIES